MTKKYDIAHLTNELAEGKSLFFTDRPKPSAQAVNPANRQSVQQQPERSNARTVEQSNGRRIITRNSFEIYEDQMDSLRERSYQDRRAGKSGSMSAMVRAAIDEFLAKK